MRTSPEAGKMSASLSYVTVSELNPMTWPAESSGDAAGTRTGATVCADSGPLTATSTGSAVHHAILLRKLLSPAAQLLPMGAPIAPCRCADNLVRALQRERSHPTGPAMLDLIED